jgi:hypothetical protein
MVCGGIQTLAIDSKVGDIDEKLSLTLEWHLVYQILAQ